MAESKTPLTVGVRRLLDVFRILALIGLIAWPLIVIALTMGKSDKEGTWGVDISVFAGFAIDLAALEADLSATSGVREPVIRGKSELSVETTSVRALHVFAALTEIAGLVGFYILLQLRATFRSLEAGSSFNTDNSLRIRNIGIVVIVWALVNPLLQFFGGRAILEQFSVVVPGVSLQPAFELSGLGIFIGLAMLVLSGVLNEAKALHEEQKLTI